MFVALALAGSEFATTRWELNDSTDNTGSLQHLATIQNCTYVVSMSGVVDEVVAVPSVPNMTRSSLSTIVQPHDRSRLAPGSLN